ncbi:tRNA pseudouridine(55) synthase TruB [Amphiplicatus metriothermophilus]|uniref:tRNA pseudouridine synthase B n=1 Tax=Amphiplicatus metriothermophilus TaxID=1519374 RepID=A0A239PK08_9PROT|nr:tRNA pseudouridine(55) synthase TruB [Amphiplicatus metriothermophilus]MBB5517529.1 tRNA pseudouridine55 synthase [Amphiplicatus metriothermophilus]SNT68136.1 tRNA pseudouridine synthase B [Amphiplicatus metriothermophilus]
MGRRRKKGRPVSGWLVLDKAYDLGSTEAVAKAKWLFQAQKAGHAGTLDPLATGVLPIAFGEATKTAPYVMEAAKVYRFTARWGAATATDDAEGAVIARADRRPDAAAIEAVLARFTGEIEQVPPQFSAVKVAGERAYDLAREGETVALKPRRVEIRELRLIDTPDPDHAVFEAVTGKGAYVRALVRDMARALGTEGHVSALRRTAVGPFRAEEAVTLDALETMEGPEARDAALLPVEAALAGLPQAAIGGPEAERLRRGQPAVLSPATARGVRAGEAGRVPAVLASLHGEAVAICELDGLKLKPVRVFNP